MLDSQAKCWRSNVSASLATQPRHSCLFQTLDVANIVHHHDQKEAAHSALNGNDQLSSLALYKSSHSVLSIWLLYIYLIYQQHYFFVTCFIHKSLLGKIYRVYIGSVMCADLRMSITCCLTAQHILTSDTHMQLCSKDVYTQ